MSFYISEFNKLQTRQKQLEKSQKTIMEQIEHSDYTSFKEISQVFQKVNPPCDETIPKNRIREIIDKLRNVRKAVILECGNNIPDLTIFRKELITILNEIQEIKSFTQLKIQDLESERNSSDEEMNIYREKMLSWEEPNKIVLKNTVVSKINPSPCLPKNVEAFMEFCKNSNGHENGWLISDHQLFLKLRKKHKNVHTLAMNFNKILPDVSVEEVVKHENWFIKYLNMKEKHDEAIRQWQESRNDEKPKSLNETVEMQLKKTHCNDKKDARLKVKEKIKNWKSEQECKKTMLKQIEEKNIEQENFDRNRSKKIQDEKRRLIQQWRDEKLASYLKEKEISEAKAHFEKKIRISIANEMVKIYRMKGEVVSKRGQSTKIPEKVSKKKKPKFSQSFKDPQRIFRPTQQWLNKLFADEKFYSNQVNFIGTISKLKTPSWRKNIQA